MCMLSAVIYPALSTGHWALGTGHCVYSHLRLRFVDIAPQPSLSWLERANHRMVNRLVVLRGVFVFRRVAAADVAAVQAEPQVDPGITHGQAFLASVGRIRFAVELLRCNRAQMLAGDCHHGAHQITNVN